MARIKIALISFTVDSLFRLEEEHEDKQKREASPMSGKMPRLPEVPMNITHQFRSTSHLPSFHLLVHVQAPIWCFVQNRSHGCQHVRLWCVRTSKWLRNRVRNRHVHSFVVLCDFLCIGVPMFEHWRGKPEQTPFSTLFSQSNPLPKHFFLHGNCAFGNPLEVFENSCMPSSHIAHWTTNVASKTPHFSGGLCQSVNTPLVYIFLHAAFGRTHASESSKTKDVANHRGEYGSR